MDIVCCAYLYVSGKIWLFGIFKMQLDRKM